MMTDLLGCLCPNLATQTHTHTHTHTNTHKHTHTHTLPTYTHTRTQRDTTHRHSHTRKPCLEIRQAHQTHTSRLGKHNCRHTRYHTGFFGQSLWRNDAKRY